METPNYVRTLLQPANTQKTVVKRVKGIELENVWVPFFTAANAMKETTVPSEDLGAPLRLAKSKDGTVRFSANGRPSVKVAPKLNEHITMVFDNFVAGLKTYAGTVMENNAEAYAEEVTRAQAAATPIITAQLNELEAIRRQMEQAARAQAAEHGESATPAPQPEQAPAVEQAEAVLTATQEQPVEPVIEEPKAEPRQSRRNRQPVAA